jgi:hypothetical protein
MKLLIAYNFSTEESNVEASNFYRACGEQIFPRFSVQTSFLPNLRESRLYRLTTFLGVKHSTALTFSVVWWLFLNGRRFDVIVGWITNGIIAAILKSFLGWRSTGVCLILYRLFDGKERGIKPAFKRLVYRAASHGANLLLTLDRVQAESFARLLKRNPGSTRSLTYGVDTAWYDSRIETFLSPTKTATIFCPGSAYRDDSTLEQAVKDMDIHVKSFKLDASGLSSTSKVKIGRALVERRINVPYTEYIAECCNSTVVVIAVNNSDKPAGLTSLLECMALGRPVIIANGASSRDYVRDRETGFMYEEGNWRDLREKIIYLLDNPEVVEKIGIAARKSAQKDFGLSGCGELFFQYLCDMRTIK